MGYDSDCRNAGAVKCKWNVYLKFDFKNLGEYLGFFVGKGNAIDFVNTDGGCKIKM